MTACSGFPALVWDEVKLALNDSFTGWPITFNPYVTFYYELQSIGLPGAGGPGSVSAACFPCETNNYDFFIGMTPTINLEKYWGIPVTLKAPTYVTVGPTSFWNNYGSTLFGAIERRRRRVHDRPHRHHAADIHAGAVRPLVRQGRLPVVRCHQHRSAECQFVQR